MQKNNQKIFAVFAIFFLLVAMCFFLPDKLFAIRDAQKLKEVKMSGEKPLAVQDAEQLTMERKLRLFYNGEKLDSMKFIYMETTADEEQKIQRVIQREIANLRRYQLLPKNLTVDLKNEVEKLFLQKYFILNMEEEEIFMSIWVVWVYGLQGEEIVLGMEEESGKVFALHVVGMKRIPSKQKKRKAFRKYLRKELSLDKKKIPQFNVRINMIGYTVCPEFFYYGFGMKELGMFDGEYQN